MGIISNKSFTAGLDIKELTPILYPVTLAEQKLFSRIDGTYEDTLIQTLINASTKLCERYVRGGFITRQWQQKEDAGSENTISNVGLNFRSYFLSDIYQEYAIELHNIKITSIDEVVFYDQNDNAHVISNTLYRLDREDTLQSSRVVFKPDTTIVENARFFTQYKIKYTAGWANAAAVPDDIKIAIMQNAQQWYEQREKIGELSEMCESILDSYRQIEV
jgi:hypothetical protein